MILAAMTSGQVATKTLSLPGVPSAPAGSTSTRRSSPTISAATGSGRCRRQFYRYGHNRARTIRKHPASLSWRQLAVPALFAGLASPWRRPVLVTYAAIVLGRGALELTRDPPAVPTLLAAFPTMHVAWGLGFARGIVGTGGSVRLLAPGTGSQEKLFLAGRTTSLGSG